MRRLKLKSEIRKELESRDLVSCINCGSHRVEAISQSYCASDSRGLSIAKHKTL